MAVMHVEHAQPAKMRATWCGAQVQGPRIVGVESLAYYEGSARVCQECLLAIFGAFARHEDDESA